MSQVRNENSRIKFKITPARSKADLDHVKRLFKSYAESLGIDLSFQSFEEELASLPGRYARERGGEILLARFIGSSDVEPGRETGRGKGVDESGKGGEVQTGDRDGDEDSEEDGEVVGCVALRSLPPQTTNSETSLDQDAHDSLERMVNIAPPLAEPGRKICEMKRLYTLPLPTIRNQGLGLLLATSILHTAIDLGYDETRLDTLPSMVAAQKLYKRLGFEEMEKYCENPVEGCVYLRKVLTSPPSLQGQKGEGEK